MKRALIAAMVGLLAFNAWAAGKSRPPAAPPETRQLQILQRIMPTYEPDAGAEGGCVTVKFLIKHDGFVGDVSVLEARPTAMAEPTVAALKQWQFQSFPPPDVYAVQTFKFPDTTFRLPYLVLTSEGDLNSAGCGAAPPAKLAAPLPGTRELRILQKVMPTYEPGPGVGGGCVAVKFVIKHTGFVGDITILEAKPASLAEPTIAALKQWQFQSFEPPDLQAMQTFHFTPELVRLPETVIRSPYGVLSGEGALASTACGAGKAEQKPDKRGAKKG